MTISSRLRDHIERTGTPYETVPHHRTATSRQSALAAHVPGSRMAKSVVLHLGSGYALAVLPASHHIRLAELRRQFGDDVALASEHEIEDLFEDCVRGAVPAVGECYGLDTLVDESIEEQPEVFFEAGDHATLVRMSSRQFANLTAAARHARFSAPHWCLI